MKCWVGTWIRKMHPDKHTHTQKKTNHPTSTIDIDKRISKLRQTQKQNNNIDDNGITTNKRDSQQQQQHPQWNKERQEIIR